jgi:hypothetical protein
MEGKTAMSGALVARRIKAKGPGLAWKVHNYLRWSFVKALIGVFFIVPLARLFGIMTAYGRLEAVLIKGNGERINYSLLSLRVVTDAFVAYVVDDWDGGSNVIDLFNYHGCGTGTGSEAAGDTALGTECTTALNPDNTRATGTKTQPAAYQMRSVGTLTFDASAAVTEHGVLTQSATGGGTLMDRSVFSAINVANGDSIQFTYTMTLTSGG